MSLTGLRADIHTNLGGIHIYLGDIHTYLGNITITVSFTGLRAVYLAKEVVHRLRPNNFCEVNKARLCTTYMVKSGRNRTHRLAKSIL